MVPSCVSVRSVYFSVCLTRTFSIRVVQLPAWKPPSICLIEAGTVLYVAKVSIASAFELSEVHTLQFYRRYLC